MTDFQGTLAVQGAGVVIAVVASMAASRADVASLREDVKSLQGLRDDLTRSLLRSFIHGDHVGTLQAISAAADGSQDYIDDYIVELLARGYEGLTLWLILDSVGLPTIGVGNMVPDVAAYCQLPMRKASGELATPAEIAADFSRVSRMAPCKRPDFYHCASSLMMDKADILSLLRSRVIGFDMQLQATFPWFEGLPIPAKKATLDMAFNCGVGRPAGATHKASGLHEYTHLLADLNSTPPNFTAASQVCTREHGALAFAGRNAWTVQLYQQAAAEMAAAVVQVNA